MVDYLPVIPLGDLFCFICNNFVYLSGLSRWLGGKRISLPMQEMWV